MQPRNLRGRSQSRTAADRRSSPPHNCLTIYFAIAAIASCLPPAARGYRTAQIASRSRQSAMLTTWSVFQHSCSTPRRMCPSRLQASILALPTGDSLAAIRCRLQEATMNCPEWRRIREPRKAERCRSKPQSDAPSLALDSGELITTSAGRSPSSRWHRPYDRDRTDVVVLWRVLELGMLSEGAGARRGALLESAWSRARRLMYWTHGSSP